MTTPQFLGYATKAPEQAGESPQTVAVLSVSGQKFMMDASALQQKMDENSQDKQTPGLVKESAAYGDMLGGMDLVAKQNLQTIKSADDFKGQPAAADPSLRAQPLFLGYANQPPDKDGNQQPVAVVNINGQKTMMTEEDLYNKCNDIEIQLDTNSDRALIASGSPGSQIDSKKELRDYATIMGGLQDLQAKGDAGTQGLQTISSAADFKVAANAIPENTDRNAPGIGTVSVAVANTLSR